jgi:two-component system, OmpR family, phosphate regulon response regulator OmpR
MKVLILDDDLKLGRLVVGYLAKHGVGAKHAPSPRDFERILRQDPADVLVLDVMLPDKDGFAVLRELRARADATPVLMLTARGELADKVLGLESGADDYLPKPFEPRELLARLQALARRGQPAAAGVSVHGRLRLDHGRRSASLDGRELGLSAYEFAGLAALAATAGRVLSRDQLMDRLRGVEHDANDRSLDVLVSRLRKLLGDDPRKPAFIKTVYGTGYLFLEQA